jgi:hypothetical protein
MGIAERKERDKEELRERILVAAKTLFLEKGVEKTSIRNIADLIYNIHHGQRERYMMLNEVQRSCLSNPTQ